MATLFQDMERIAETAAQRFPAPGDAALEIRLAFFIGSLGALHPRAAKALESVLRRPAGKAP